MSYQPRSTNPYIMEKKLNECVGGSGFDPSVLEEIQTEISILGSENAAMAQDIVDIKGSLNSIKEAKITTLEKTINFSSGGNGETDIPLTKDIISVTSKDAWLNVYEQTDSSVYHIHGVAVAAGSSFSGNKTVTIKLLEIE